MARPGVCTRQGEGWWLVGPEGMWARPTAAQPAPRAWRKLRPGGAPTSPSRAVTPTASLRSHNRAAAAAAAVASAPAGSSGPAPAASRRCPPPAPPPAAVSASPAPGQRAGRRGGDERRGGGGGRWVGRIEMRACMPGARAVESAAASSGTHAAGASSAAVRGSSTQAAGCRCTHEAHLSLGEEPCDIDDGRHRPRRQQLRLVHALQPRRRACVWLVWMCAASEWQQQVGSAHKSSKRAAGGRRAGGGGGGGAHRRRRG